jgi:hypothetical protein
MSIDTDHNKKVYAKMVARAWLDGTFEQALRADPRQAAIDAGMSLPAAAGVVLADAGDGFAVDTSGPSPVLTLTLPPRPGDLTDDDLQGYDPDGGGQPQHGPLCCANCWAPRGACSSSHHP